MADNIGFLEQLGIPAVDERAILEAKRAEGWQAGGNDMEFTAGQQARPLLIGALGALGGLLTGQTPEGESGRSLRGLAANFAAGVHREDDRQIAAAAGISPETLKARRAIRNEVSKIKPKGEVDGFTSQIEMARRVAQLALKHGDAQTYGRAVAALSSLKVQKQEFDKLKAQTDSAESDAEQSDLIDAFHNGKPVTGAFAFGEDESGELVPGLTLGNPNGQSTFVPFGPELARDDPSARVENETLDQRIRRSTAKQFVADLKKQIADSASSTRKFGRVMGTVADLVKKSNTSALGGSGKFLSFIDDAVQNIKGVGKAFFGSGGVVDSASTYRVSSDGKRASGIRAWMKDMIANPNADVWASIQLPDGVVEASEAAQLYRANLMELAYMAARLAEPSNRGLSDNDIRNALQRLGDSNRPEIILTRFAEILGDGAFDIEQKMGTLYGNFGEQYSNEEIQQTVGGDTYFNYKQQLDEIQDTYGFSYGKYGEVSWTDLPETEDVPQPVEPPVNLKDMEDDEFSERFLNDGSF